MKNRKLNTLMILCLILALLILPCSQASAAGLDGREYTEKTGSSEEVVKVSESSGDGSEQLIQESYVNPLYEDVIELSDLKDTPSVMTLAEGEASEPDLSEYASTVEEAAVQIRENMKQRKETFDVYFKAARYVDGMMKEIAETGLEHTGDPEEGDYLRWQFGGWKADGSIRKPEGEDMCYMTFTYTFTYYSTAEQEASVDEKVAEVLEDLDVETASDYTKLYSIYDYICSHTVYDYDNLNDKDYTMKYTAYAALIDEKAVCQGYAVLFYRMALELGVDSRLIAGTGNNENHGWNIAKLDDLYYNLDTTWDAGMEEYEYFLKCEENFGGHTRFDEYDTEAFHAAYPMSSEDYQAETDEGEEGGTEEVPGTGEEGGTEEVPGTGEEGGTEEVPGADEDEVTSPHWVQEGSLWWYCEADGSWPASEWKFIDGEWYYFNASGYMVTGWLWDGNAWYYLEKSGAMATGWLWDGGSWYYLKTDGAMATGWLWDGNAWYYLEKNGAMATGWLWDGNAWYYLKNSGAMATGWLLDGGSWYYLNSSGAMVTGWQWIGDAWYYFNQSGVMQSGKWVDGYYLTEEGKMASNVQAEQ